jgi:cytochrome c oxidase subunit 2
VKRASLGLKIFGVLVSLAVTVMFGLMIYDAIFGNEGKPLTTLSPQGPSAQTIQNLIVPVFAIAGVVFVGVPAIILYICWKYRDTGDEATADDVPAQLHGKTWAEITWTAIPALILVVVAVLTVGTISALEAKEPDALQVKVEGQQWWWQFRYDLSNDGAGNGSWDDPEDVVTANELVVPTGRQVALTQTSNDVIHSFWIPALNGKKDAVPGMDTHWSLQADTVGVYRGQCTEFCGLSHGNMRMLVRAIEPADFATWTENQQREAVEPAEGTLEAQGKEVFEAQLCSSCHLIRGVNDEKVANPETGVEAELVAGVAPDLTHFATRGTFAGSIFNSHYPNPAGATENQPFGQTCVLARQENPDNLPTCPPANQKDAADTVFAPAPGNPDNPTNPVALADWLRDPEKIKPMAPEPEPEAGDRRRGMPNLKLSEEQISQLVAYLNSLK